MIVTLMLSSKHNTRQQQQQHRRQRLLKQAAQAQHHERSARNKTLQAFYTTKTIDANSIAIAHSSVASTASKSSIGSAANAKALCVVHSSMALYCYLCCTSLASTR